MRKIISRTVVLTALMILVILPVKAKDTINIGSKNFPESRLLAEIMALMIEENSDSEVDIKANLGGTLICFEALRTGGIDLYPEYTGTGLTVILKENLFTNNPDKVYERVKQEFIKKYNLDWLEPFGFNNTYALAVSEEVPVKTISGLKKYKDSIPVAFTHEFLSREDGYPGLTKHYGFSFSDLRGMEHGLLYNAIEQKKIKLMDAYSTDGKLLKYNLKLLKDDKNFFPPYHAAPLVRMELLEKHPEIRDALEPLANILNDQEMLKLNYQIEVKGRGFEEVAREFLVSRNLIKPLKNKVKGRKIPLFSLTVEHLTITLIATGMAIMVGVPLGLLISRKKKLSGPVLAVSGVIQTVPSLAILGFMIPIFGIGLAPAIAALFLYALLPIIRNTFTGINSVEPSLKEAAKAMGMTPFQIMYMLELPLATKIIMAGIRTALVINIGTATLAAFIGAGGLGELIVTGLSLNDNSLILWGAIPAAVLALIVDYILSGFEYLIEPKGLRIGRH